MRAKRDCRLCGGSGVYRLPMLEEAAPLFRPASADEIDLQPATRIYEISCPKCFPVTQDQFVDWHVRENVARWGQLDDERRQETREAVATAISRKLADHLLREGFIDIVELPGMYPDGKSFEGVVVAAKPELRRTIAERRRETAMEYVKRAFSKLKYEVSNWGSHYGRQDIEKAKVYDFCAGVERDIAEYVEAGK